MVGVENWNWYIDCNWSSLTIFTFCVLKKQEVILSFFLFRKQIWTYMICVITISFWETPSVVRSYMAEQLYHLLLCSVVCERIRGWQPSWNRVSILGVSNIPRTHEKRRKPCIFLYHLYQRSPFSLRIVIF